MVAFFYPCSPFTIHSSFLLVFTSWRSCLRPKRSSSIMIRKSSKYKMNTPKSQNTENTSQVRNEQDQHNFKISRFELFLLKQPPWSTFGPLLNSCSFCLFRQHIVEKTTFRSGVNSPKIHLKRSKRKTRGKRRSKVTNAFECKETDPWKSWMLQKNYLKKELNKYLNSSMQSWIRLEV